MDWQFLKPTSHQIVIAFDNSVMEAGAIVISGSFPSNTLSAAAVPQHPAAAAEYLTGESHQEVRFCPGSCRRRLWLPANRNSRLATYTQYVYAYGLRRSVEANDNAE